MIYIPYVYRYVPKLSLPTFLFSEGRYLAERLNVLLSGTCTRVEWLEVASILLHLALKKEHSFDYKYDYILSSSANYDQRKVLKIVKDRGLSRARALNEALFITANNIPL